MRRKHALGMTLVASLLALGSAGAAETWVVQFLTPFPDVIPPCQTVLSWHSHLMLHNTTTDPLEVGFLGVSNGDPQPDAANLFISPGRTASVRQDSPPTLHWSPATFAPLWVNKLDIPEGIVVANRLESGIAESVGGPDVPCEFRSQISAGLPLRVFTELVPASIPQYHLGTDVGDYLSALRIDARINVGVYNDAAEPAMATIEVRCSPGPVVDIFDEPDPLIATTTLRVPVRSVAQTTVLTSTEASPCPISAGAAPYHVVVTSDQAGFSYVTGVLNGALPKFPVGTSITF